MTAIDGDLFLFRVQTVVPTQSATRFALRRDGKIADQPKVSNATTSGTTWTSSPCATGERAIGAQTGPSGDWMLP